MVALPQLRINKSPEVWIKSFIFPDVAISAKSEVFAFPFILEAKAVSKSASATLLFEARAPVGTVILTLFEFTAWACPLTLIDSITFTCAPAAIPPNLFFSGVV